MKISRNKLGLAMLKAGISNSKELAASAQVSVNTVSRIMNGLAATIPVIQKIAAALGVDPAEIVEEG